MFILSDVDFRGFRNTFVMVFCCNDQLFVVFVSVKIDLRMLHSVEFYFSFGFYSRFQLVIGCIYYVSDSYLKNC